SLDEKTAFLVDLGSGQMVSAHRVARADDRVVVLLPDQVLSEGNEYAAVLTKAVHDLDGRALRADADFATIASGAAQAALYAPLWSWLSARGIARDSLAAATVFTVHSSMSTLAQLRTALATLPLAQPAVSSAATYSGSAALDEFFGPVPHGHVAYVVQGSVP